ncbi:GNAT family N-acetyltransferase [Rubrobacter marinus]|uniref:GNAT family N-acetyltransferase n=1 Tax=Rubrobacter marinus TaxID=2653852 RepID=UPI00140C3DF0|nr:GNAT family N-acetyltransferase [Rubrobacter marinus]
MRGAVAADAEAVHGLAGELAEALGDKPPDLPAVRKRLLELLDEPRARVLVVEGEEGLVGAATLWIKPDLAHGDVVIEVPMLVVAGEARRRGVGKLLVDGIREVAASEGATLVELIATSDNSVARAFYRSLGFVETDHVSLEFVGDMQDPPDPDE